MINFAIPGFYELADFNLSFLNLFYTKREYFYDDININAVYGNPQFCIWDGGRIFSHYKQASSEKVRDLIKEYNDFGLPIRYVFTNPILQEKHYKDRFCNILMELAHNGKNQVVVNDDKLYKYLKNMYPNYFYISSTTKCLNKEQILEELKTNYNMICLDYNLNNNINLLKSIEEKTKVELLINPICAPGCPHRKEHYKLNGISHLNYGKQYSMKNCYIQADPFFPDPKAHGNNISYEQIKEIYHPIGIENYKIEGRTWEAPILALTYVDYMVKPEYKNYVLSIIL